MAPHTLELGIQHLRGYGLAAVAVLAAVLLRMGIPDALGDTPFLAFYPAVVIAAVLGGAGPGMLATIMSAIGVGLLFDPTPGWNHFRDHGVLIRLGLFLTGGLATSLAVGSVRASRAYARQQAAALRESEWRLRTFFESGIVGVIYWNMDGRVTAANDRFLQMVGYSREDLAAGRIDWVKMTPPQYRALDERSMAELKATGVNRAPLEKEYLRKDGTRIPVIIAGAMLGEKRYEGVAFVLDISERKRAEEALAAAKMSAEQAMAAAEEASRAKDRFLAVLSHELRTPLTPVVAGVSMLQERQQDERTMRETLEMVRRNVEMEARLIDDLLDVTRIVRGKIELDRKPMYLCEVLRRAVEVCKPDIETRQIDFGIDIGRDAPYRIDADPARLQQVFWNLLKNAVKFTPHGGCIGVRCHREDKQVVIEVTDSGEGIDPALLPHIFNAFEQGGTQVTRQFGGLGLGLTITRGVVEMHGGTIDAHSEGKGKGATFRIRLPLCGGPEPLAACPPDSTREVALGRMLRAPAPGRKLRILLVEDHGDTARAMQRLLSARGHHVEIAGDVATALERAEAESFDLLLSDLGLPDGSGMDLLRKLREHGRMLPGIALSGYGQEEDIRRSKEAGFAAHLTKPTNPDVLTRTIDTIVHHGTARS